MQMPDRSYSAGNQYRYGFQSQEIDDELWGEAVSFKHRVEDPRLGRFFSVDLLAAKYSYNSPYAFSENRVIDGKELEGLEYVSIHHRVDGTDIKMHYKSTDEDIKKINGTTSSFSNSASYGPLGKGVVHYYYDSKGQLIPEATSWEQKQTGGESDLTYHGLYSGPGSVTKDGHPKSSNYDFSFQPIDWADAIAKRHDMDYAAATSTGEKYAGFLEDVRTLQADKDMIERIRNIQVDNINPFQKNSVEGVETPFRTSTSKEMLGSLFGQLNVINALAEYKEWKIKNKYTNSDTYDKIGKKFKKKDPINGAIIDAIIKK